MTEIAPLHRTLEQELNAVLRGASLECLVCGEFVQHRNWYSGARTVACPECGARLRAGVDSALSGLQSSSQAG